MTEDEAEEIIRRMMATDPDTAEVVQTMRSQGRIWSKIYACFRFRLKALGISN